MTQVQPISPAAPASEDLSEAIEQSMQKEPGEEVRTVRVFGDYYRCNWWAPAKPAHAWFQASGTIRKSQFLRATKVANQLVMEDVTKG